MSSLAPLARARRAARFAPASWAVLTLASPLLLAACASTGQADPTAAVRRTCVRTQATTGSNISKRVACDSAEGSTDASDTLRQLQDVQGQLTAPANR